MGEENKFGVGMNQNNNIEPEFFEELDDTNANSNNDSSINNFYSGVENDNSNSFLNTYSSVNDGINNIYPSSDASYNMNAMPNNTINNPNGFVNSGSIGMTSSNGTGVYNAGVVNNSVSNSYNNVSTLNNNIGIVQNVNNGSDFISNQNTNDLSNVHNNLSEANIEDKNDNLNTNDLNNNGNNIQNLSESNAEVMTEESKTSDEEENVPVKKIKILNYVFNYEDVILFLIGVVILLAVFFMPKIMNRF